MKDLLAAACALTLLLFAIPAPCETFDAVKDYSCAESGPGVWRYEGFRAEDGAYLAMAFGHPLLREVSRYGVDAHYIPDSGQRFYPYITRFGDQLFCSPATQGKRFDAVLTWVSPVGGEVAVSGFARLVGDLKGNAKGRKVRASVLINGAELWAADVTGETPGDFKLKAGVALGDKVRLHIRNAGDGSGNMTAFNLHVEAAR